MENLEDLLSETDGEGHLNLPSGQFSFAAIRRHLGKAQAPPGSGDKDEYIDWDPQLTKGLWDISALGLQDYRHADDLEEEEEEEEEEEPDEDADAEDQEAESYADLHFRRGPARTEEFRDGWGLKSESRSHAVAPALGEAHHAMRTRKISTWSRSGFHCRETRAAEVRALEAHHQLEKLMRRRTMRIPKTSPRQVLKPGTPVRGAGCRKTSCAPTRHWSAHKAVRHLPARHPRSRLPWTSPLLRAAATRRRPPPAPQRRPLLCRRMPGLQPRSPSSEREHGRSQRCLGIPDPWQPGRRRRRSAPSPSPGAKATMLSPISSIQCGGRCLPSLPALAQSQARGAQPPKREAQSPRARHPRPWRLRRPATRRLARLGRENPQQAPSKIFEQIQNWTWKSASLARSLGAGEGSLAGAQAEGRRKAGRKSQGPETSRAERERAERRERPDDEAAAEAKARLTALDEELKKYEKENETLKKLQASARNAERDIAREREKLWKEVEAERTALHAEFDVERAALRKERRRLAEAADRQRQQLKEEKEAQEERQRLQEKADQLEEEMKEKEKRWQRTVDRLQRQVTEFTKKNSELQEEVKRLNQQAAQAQQSSWLKEVAAAKRGLSANRKRSGSVGPAVTNTVSSGSSNAAGRMESVASAASAPIGGASGTSGAPPPSTALRGTETARPRAASATPKVSATEEVRETRRLDGRVERIFGDGRREVEFSNGLKKVMWPDGQTSVMFQNGDLKEIREDGVVVYHYRATGAVQTTLTDGTELYQFNDGQTERHCLDGSKEIRFPNGTTKKIFDDGSEEVCFADGTMKRTSAK
ncbi:unnamed protein product [Effrenium voratum]|nr:unnamed protein product [Effrenium voratum]